MKRRWYYLIVIALLTGWSAPGLAAQACSLEQSQCGGDEALGCSTQQAMAPLAALSPELGQLLVKYSGRFEPACIRHDFCYRHGWRTYQYNQMRCDNDFENAMYDICQNIESTDLLNLAVELGECLASARVFAETVREVGEQYFQKSGSSCCFYEGETKSVLSSSGKSD